MHHILISFQGIQGYLVSAIRPFTPVSLVYVGTRTPADAYLLSGPAR